MSFLMRRMLDQDGDGLITMSDFYIIANNYGLGVIGLAAIEHAFRYFDTNGDGILDKHELNAALAMLRGHGYRPYFNDYYGRRQISYGSPFGYNAYPRYY